MYGGSFRRYDRGVSATVRIPPAPPRSATLPYGQSPFHVKGVLFQGLFEWLDRHVEGGRARVIADCSPDLRAFLEKPLLAGSWFDVFALVDTTVVAAKVNGTGHLATMRSIAIEQCERDFHGVYKMLLRLASPDAVLERIPKTAQTYFDFVTAEVEKVGPGHYRTVGRGIPVHAMHAYMAVTEAFLTRVLVLTGAKDLQHRWLPPEADGYHGAIARVRARREIRWDAT